MLASCASTKAFKMACASAWCSGSFFPQRLHLGWSQNDNRFWSSLIHPMSEDNEDNCSFSWPIKFPHLPQLCWDEALVCSCAFCIKSWEAPGYHVMGSPWDPWPLSKHLLCTQALPKNYAKKHVFANISYANEAKQLRSSSLSCASSASAWGPHSLPAATDWSVSKCLRMI